MGYFDGSEAGELGLLYIHDDHYFTYKAGMGFGTNNFADLLALKLLLTLALENQITIIHIFGDSQLVINWVTSKFRVQNMQLFQVLYEVTRISDMFENVDFKHIYQERNSKADELAKAGATVPDGYWHITEFRASKKSESFQFF